MNTDEPKIPPFKRLAAQLARVLPPSWRFPVCGLSASVCGLEATRPLENSSTPDPRFLRAMAEFLGPSDLSDLALVQSHIVTIPNGIAWSRGAHLTADGRLIAPLSVGMNMPMDRWLLKRQRFFPKIRRVPGPVISLATDGHNNFYHWMLDLLPKLFLILAAGIANKPISSISPISPLFLGTSTPFQKQTLDLLGLPPAQLLDCNATPFLQADQLIVPFLGERHPPNIFSAAKCRLLVSVFSSLIDRNKPAPDLPPRFIISRNKTRSRRVINESELLAQLEPLGFRPIYLEDLSLVKQIALFARAEAIVASTGAGLINLIHCPPNIPVAILMPEECPDLVCRDIASFAHLNAEIFYGQRHPPGTPDKIGCDMVLDAQLLTRLTGFFHALKNG